MFSALEKTKILIEALPYIEKFNGKTVVIKYGGNAMINEELKKAVMQDVILMKYVGIQPIIVHGGGPEITSMLNRLAIKSEFIKGLRVTDAATMEIVEMVLVGKVNKDIVSLINSLGGKAVGLCGKDGSLIKAHKQFAKDDNGNETIDIGLVGEVAEVSPQILQTVMEAGFIPVISPVGFDDLGNTYNINADYVAGEIASALGADKLVLLTDVEGIYRDFNDKNSLISELKVAEVEELIANGVISSGMIPKVECCALALKKGVGRTHIIDGRIPHSVLLEVFTDEGIGTMVVK